MVCPYKSPETRRKQQEAAEKAESVGNPEDVRDLLKALASADPEVRRRAAFLFEVSSLGAIDEARAWQEQNANDGTLLPDTHSEE